MLSEMQFQIILALADNGMNVSEASRKLFTHRNNVAYHIGRIAKITGKDPLNFYDLYDLVLFAKGVIKLEGKMKTEIEGHTKAAAGAVGR